MGYSPWGLLSWTRPSMPHTSHGGWEAGVTSGRRFRRALSGPFAASSLITGGPAAGSCWLPAPGSLSALSLSQPPADAWPAPLVPAGVSPGSPRPQGE